MAGGDDRPELITGKQLLAHNGGDVGAFEPTFLFYYTMNQGHFQRHILSYSHILPHFTDARDEPPPASPVSLWLPWDREPPMPIVVWPTPIWTARPCC